MPAAIKNIPDLTVYTSYNEYLSTPGNVHISEGTYYNHRSKQIQLKPPQTTETIRNDNQNSCKKEGNIPQIGNNARNEELKPDDRKEIIEKSIWSIKKHAPTQWQCAMTALERLLPQHFAKKDGNTPLTSAIGIRITIGAREQQVTAIDAHAEIVQQQPALSDKPSVDNSKQLLNE
jgi:hypothetical protein